MPEPNELQPASPHPYSEPAQAVRVRDFRPRGFKWVKAAAALAEGATVAEAALRADVSPAAVHGWKRRDKFKALMARYEERVHREAVSTGVALQVVRLRKLGRHANRIEKVFDARAEALKDSVPGGDSGLISHDQKSIGAGPNAEIVDVYEFDAALSREYRATLEQAAKEMGGQFDQGAASNGPGVAVNVSISFPVMAKEQLEAVSAAPTIDLPPMARRLLSRPSDGQQR